MSTIVSAGMEPCLQYGRYVTTNASYCNALHESLAPSACYTESPLNQSMRLTTICFTFLMVGWLSPWSGARARADPIGCRSRWHTRE